MARERQTCLLRVCLVLAASLSSAQLIKRDAQPTSIWGGLWSMTFRWGMGNLYSSDPNPRIVKDPEATQFSVPLTVEYEYGVGLDSRLQAFRWRNGRAGPVWQSDVLRGLNGTYPPWLFVEDSVQGQDAPDVVYLLNSEDGRLYAYSASRNTTAPLWRSDFGCITKGTSPRQFLTANSAAGVLIARCTAGLTAVNITTGKRKLRLPGATVPAASPVPFPTNSSIATWKGAQVIARSVSKAGVIPWSFRLPVPHNTSAVSSVSPPWNRTLAVTVNNSATVYLISSTGKLLSSFQVVANFTEPDPTLVTLDGVSVLPTPVIHKGVLYGIATVNKLEPFGLAAPVPNFFLFAVDVSNPLKPTPLWTRPPEVGQAGPQLVQLNLRFMFVTINKYKTLGFTFQAVERATGAFAFGNNASPSNRWAPSYTSPSIVTSPWCCEMAAVSAVQNANSTVASVLNYILTVTAQGGDGLVKVEDDNGVRGCQCPP